jgi:uncharacterized protein YqgC (DUF456 family)
MDLHNLWYVLAAVLIVVGIVGTVLPALPGVPLVFAGMLVAAWADGFQHVGVWTLIGELVAGGTLQRATNVGIGAWIGFLVGTVLKLGVSFAMLGLFALAFIVH